MKKVSPTNFEVIRSSSLESSNNILRQEKKSTQGLIAGIKERISSLDFERAGPPGLRKKHDRSEDSFDLFRMAKQGFMGMLKMFQKTGLIDKDAFEEKKGLVKELFDQNANDLKKMFLRISQRDLESVVELIESQLSSGSKESKVNYEQEEIVDEDLTPPENTKNDGKNLELTLTSTLKFNNIGNSLLNLLNKVDPFNSPDEVDPSNKELLSTEIKDIHEKTRGLILSLDPSLKDDLDQVDAKAQANPDQKEAYLNYSVSMVPIDIATKAIDVVNNERDGFQDLANADRKTLAADMLDFYEYLTNLNQSIN